MKASSGPFAQFGTDRAAESEGAWMDYGTFRLRLRRAGPSNKSFVRQMEAQYLKPFARKLDAGTMTDDQSIPILARIYAETIVVDWDSDLGPHLVEGEDGKPLKFSPEACADLFVKIPDFFRIVQRDASSLETFRQAQAEADAKN